MKPLAPYESSIAEHYHEATKYTADRLRAESTSYPPLDWADQPVPMKRYEGPRVKLPTEGLPIERTDSDVDSLPTSDDGGPDLVTVAKLVWHTNGCTRIVRIGGGIQHFRAAPSAGAMYPTELYVAVRDVPGIDDGVYDYQILDHSLVPVEDGDVFGRLSEAAFGDPACSEARVAILLTAEWHRSSWRYRERGYRRALLDTGHVLGNLVEFAPEVGLRAVPIGCFRDEIVEDLLQIDPVREGPLVVVPLVAADRADALQRLPARSSPLTEWRDAMEQVGDRVGRQVPERLIAALHLGGRLRYDAAAVPPAAPVSMDAADRPVVDGDVPETSWTPEDPVSDQIAVRRSTRVFRAHPLPLRALLSAMRHSTSAPESCFAPHLLRTYIVATDVADLADGVHLYDESGDVPRLVELERGRFAEELVHLGLGQQIFVHAGAVVVHTADLTRAVQAYGDRAYRLLHLDAGHRGERLDLALLHAGLGVSGCGGYFDDEMNRVLSIPESQAVIYITTVGHPA